ncbi:class I adenylate-forming enzyme family protein [Amycolatopsis methanolica]|uniref:Long-chain-fatty-acid--CoA ligase n=1 Tax=Amycolatopsis methanolica 239 TaxID=1068978 RepID=A0A076MQN8_AMYME|nr:AMP-binding protein [Amycolatopsis methanolica]AIJ21266.1 long-chain-fatty-acid--CoA ligase [Amycolatopsis methanolica 239]
MPQTEETFRSFWERRVDATPSADFLVYEGTRQTYAEFDHSLNSLAHGLLAAGVRQGSRLAYHLPNGLDLLRVELAAQKLGAVTVPMIAGLTYPEMTYILEHAEPSHLILDAAGQRILTEGGGIGARDIRVFVFDGDTAGLDTGENQRPPAPDLDPLAPMSIRYTSGSTGRPKGVIQPSAGFASAGHAIANRLSITGEDNVFSALPLFHTAASHMMLAPAVAAGCAFTLVPQFSRTAFWQQVRDSGGTITLLMPAQISILMTAAPAPGDRDNPLRLIFSHVRSEEFCTRFGVDICTTWAMTETSGMGTLTPAGYDSYRPKLIGRPMPDDAEIKIVDPAGDELPPGEPGELCFRHPHAMIEYYRDERNTAATLRDGWVHSGDLCAMDEAGQAYFHGRLKNVIKRGGENIAGEEVEFTIMEHPAVEECVVCGVADEIYTEEVCATVVVREGCSLSEAEIVRWCARHLSDWKVPRYLRLVHTPLPKLANGKTNRGVVTRKAADDLADAWDRRNEVAIDA